MSKLPISRKTFTKYIETLQIIEQLKSDITGATKKYKDKLCLDFFSIEGLDNNVEALFIESLDEALETDWVSYWIYECNYGRDTKDKVFDSKHNPIPIDTIDQLYDLIKSEYIS